MCLFYRRTGVFHSRPADQAGNGAARRETGRRERPAAEVEDSVAEPGKEGGDLRQRAAELGDPLRMDLEEDDRPARGEEPARPAQHRELVPLDVDLHQVGMETELVAEQ